METFIEAKEFVTNPTFHEQRAQYLKGLDIQTIDRPIVDIVLDFTKIPHCYTLQSCFGHFLYLNQRDEKNIAPLPLSNSVESVKYRIAYIALCIEQSDLGETLFNYLNKIVEIDPEYIQFGSAEWFWKGHVNSYALQVEPDRYKTKDWVTVDYQEALRIEEVRNKLFVRLRTILKELISMTAS